MRKQWILASASPRRKEILEQMGLAFSVCPACGEEHSTQETPEEIVKELARQKAEEVAGRTKEEALVIGADTIVVFRGEQGETIMGKPADEADAFRMLKTLQGTSHMVYTGAALVDARTGELLLNFAEGTKVSMYPMPDAWIWEYIRTGDPMDKAGAYAIQGACGLWIREIQGNYATVMGFPAARFYQELRRIGIDLTGTEEGCADRACIFDLDGTLCDTVESIACCANRALRDLGLREASFADYKKFVGDGVDMLVHRLLQFGGDTKEVHFAELKEKYVEYFREGCMYHVKAYPGVPEALKRLRELGARLGVISNKPHANTVNVIRHVFGEGVFDWVQGQTEELPRKPDPAGALYTAKKLGVPPEKCLYIGDTGTDMCTGKAAGMYNIGVLWGFRDREELERTGAEEVIEKPEALVRIYEKKGRERGAL